MNLILTTCDSCWSEIAIQPEAIKVFLCIEDGATSVSFTCTSSWCRKKAEKSITKELSEVLISTGCEVFYKHIEDIFPPVGEEYIAVFTDMLYSSENILDELL